MSESFLDHVRSTLLEIDEAGMMKVERPITSAQGGVIEVEIENKTHEVINLCANNYLGLANHPRLVAAAKAALDDHGYGMASVRFICGTQDLHRQLEHDLAAIPRQG